MANKRVSTEERMQRLEAAVAKTEAEMATLRESVKRAVDSVLPRVEALLSGRIPPPQGVVSSETATPPLDGESGARAEPTPALHAAATRGDAEALRRLLDEGAWVKMRDANGDTAAHCAARGGYVNCLQVLLEKGAMVKTVGRKLQTVLHVTAAAGHTTAVEYLLDSGADMEQKDGSGSTPLALAASAGLCRVISLLLKKGASLDTRNSVNYTPFQLAAASGHMQALDVLLEKLYSFVEQDKNKYESKFHENIRQAMEVAANETIVCILADWDPSAVQGSVGQGALIHAACDGRLGSLTALLDAGVSANERGSSVVLPLHEAVRHGQRNCAEVLLQRGAKVNGIGERSSTPLHVAVKNNQEACVKMLLEFGADKSIRDICKRVPKEYTENKSILKLLEK